MLGLPDGARACLFDLDGVLTDDRHRPCGGVEADVRRLPARPLGAGRHALPRVRRQGRLRPVRRRQARAWTACARSSSRAASTCPTGSPDGPPDAETLWGLATRKNDLVQEKIRTVGVDAYPGSVRYLHAVKDAGLATACVSSSANARQVLEVARLDVAVRRTASTASSPSSAACGASPPPTRSSPPRPTWASRQGAGRRLRGRAWRGCSRGARAGSASWWASTGSGTRTRCGSTAPTSSCVIYPNY